MVFETYRDFGFDAIDLALSLRPDQRVGADELWDKAEAALAQSLDDKGLTYRIQPGEGAFYGPKIEFTLHDSIGRAWQCGTIQVDFSMPGRLGAHYIAEDNSKQTPVMIHRAILGSVERFIGILIEHYAGLLPVWLAPVQAVALNITDRQADYVKEVVKTLRDKGFRAEFDLRNEKIGFKIREHTLQRVPYLLVVGDREVETRSLSVRDRQGQDLGSFGLDAFIERLSQDVANRIH
jgi:threonyl-tRNA synthetase